MPYAVFYELFDDTEAVQNLFIPAIRLSGRMTLPRLFQRSITRATMNKRFTMVSSSSYLPDPNYRSRSLDDAVGYEMEQLAGVSHVMRGPLTTPGLRLRGSYPVPVTESDFLNLLEEGDKVPVALMRRVNSLRVSNGFPVAAVGGV